MKKAMESYFDNERRKLKRYTSMFKKKHPGIAKNVYPEKLPIIFERYIEIYGHAYCMDVASERRKLAKLLHRALNELKS